MHTIRQPAKPLPEIGNFDVTRRPWKIGDDLVVSTTAGKQLLEINARTIARFQAALSASRDFSHNSDDIPAAFFGRDTRASLTWDGECLRLLYVDDRQRWMAQVRYPHDYPIDFTSEIADRDMATRLATEMSAMLAAVASMATIKPQASPKTIRDRLQQAGDAWCSTHAGIISTLMVYATTPWSHACIRAKVGKQVHVDPIDLQNGLVVVSTHRNNGWLHLQVEPAVHLGNT